MELLDSLEKHPVVLSVLTAADDAPETLLALVHLMDKRSISALLLFHIWKAISVLLDKPLAVEQRRVLIACALQCFRLTPRHELSALEQAKSLEVWIENQWVQTEDFQSRSWLSHMIAEVLLLRPPNLFSGASSQLWSGHPLVAASVSADRHPVSSQWLLSQLSDACRITTAEQAAPCKVSTFFFTLSSELTLHLLQLVIDCVTLVFAALSQKQSIHPLWCLRFPIVEALHHFVTCALPIALYRPSSGDASTFIRTDFAVPILFALTSACDLLLVLHHHHVLQQQQASIEFERTVSLLAAFLLCPLPWSQYVAADEDDIDVIELTDSTQPLHLCHRLHRLIWLCLPQQNLVEMLMELTEQAISSYDAHWTPSDRHALHQSMVHQPQSQLELRLADLTQLPAVDPDVATRWLRTQFTPQTVE